MAMPGILIGLCMMYSVLADYLQHVAMSKFRVYRGWSIMG